MSHKLEPIQPDRGVGFGLLTFCGLLVYWGIITPLISASHHEKNITISSKLIVFIPVLSTIGLIYAILGKNTQRLTGLPKRLTVLGGVIMVISLFLGFYLDYWLKNRLNDYGYSF
jgi:hypothetical protein